MKPKPTRPSFPSVTKHEVEQEVEKSEVIYLRVTPAEKEAVKEAASKLKMTATEYLMKCHELVARKL